MKLEPSLEYYNCLFTAKNVLTNSCALEPLPRKIFQPFPNKMCSSSDNGALKRVISLYLSLPYSRPLSYLISMRESHYYSKGRALISGVITRHGIYLRTFNKSQITLRECLFQNKNEVFNAKEFKKLE